jgi:hypothetical protein
MGGVTRRQIAAAAAAAHLKTLGLEALRQFGACEALSLRREGRGLECREAGVRVRVRCLSNGREQSGKQAHGNKYETHGKTQMLNFSVVLKTLRRTPTLKLQQQGGSRHHRRKHNSKQQPRKRHEPNAVLNY